MPTFTDSENRPPKNFQIQPAGDYRFCCVGMKVGIQTSSRTAGSNYYEMEIELERPHPDKTPGELLAVTLYDRLIEHPSCLWKIDTFTKCCNGPALFHIVKGTPYEFVRSVAESKNVTWLNPIGLRGILALKQEVMMKDSKPMLDETGKPKLKNVVAVYYTNQEKLPPRDMGQEEEVTPF